MARYIDAVAFEKQLNRYVEYNDDGEQEINADEVFITLHEQPTADVVERKRGEWIWLASTYDRIPCEKRFWCSECHHETITFDREPWERFCPNCGADMRGERDERT